MEGATASSVRRRCEIPKTSGWNPNVFRKAQRGRSTRRPLRVSDLVVGRTNSRSDGDGVQPGRIARGVGISDHDLVCSGIQLYWNHDRHRRIKGAAVYIQDGRRAVIDVNIERAHAAGGVVDLEVIRACLRDRNRGKGNGVLIAGAVVSNVGTA